MSAPAAGQAALPRSADHLLLYGYSCLVTLCGMAAASYGTGAGLAMAAAITSLAGFAASWHLSRAGVPQRLVALLVVLAGCLIWLATRESEFLVWLQPGQRDEARLAAVLVLVATARSFTLYTAGDLLFSAVPSLALFGLLASFVADPGFYAWFFLFVAATLFMLGQEQHLRHAADFPGAPLSPASRVQQVASHLFFFLAVILAAWAISVGMQALGIRVQLPSSRSGGRELSQPRAVEIHRSLPIGAGPTNLSADTVMYVRADQPCYWRGAIYDTYTGHTWESSRSELGSVPLLPVANLPTQVPVVRQEYQLQVDVSGALFAAAEPVAAWATAWSEGWWMRFRLDGAGVMRARPDRVAAPAAYLVVSRPPPPARPLPAPARWEVPEVYLQGTASGRLFELAHTIVRGETAPLGQARALEAYLRRHYRYHLAVPAVPPDRDAVEYFLFEARQGYCDLFASAMVLMCRALGIPARLATGFTEGSFDREMGAWQVTFAHAHAWPEVYLPGAGWVGFEPTPPRSPRGDQPAGAAAGLTPARVSRTLLPVVSGALVLVGLLWLLLRRLRGSWRQVNLAQLGSRQAVIAAYLAYGRLLARLGLAREDWQTPREYLRALSRQAPSLGLPELVPPLTRLTNLFALARYAPAPVPAAHAQEARETLASLQADLRRLRRAARQANVRSGS